MKVKKEVLSRKRVVQKLVRETVGMAQVQKQIAGVQIRRKHFVMFIKGRTDDRRNQYEEGTSGGLRLSQETEDVLHFKGCWMYCSRDSYVWGGLLCE